MRRPMEVLNYYVTTLVNAFKNLTPYIAFLVGGYLVFVKMPFLFLRKSMDEQKQRMKEEEAKRIKIEHREIPKQKHKQEEKREERRKEEHKKEERKQAPRPQTRKDFPGFRPEDLVSKEVLKKRYLELIKENHPDRVASMGKEFKELAEKNTKEINETYERLKKKAS